jgi:hypothetical protein
VRWPGLTPSGVAKAHRVAYMLFVGPIPEGLDPDHLCYLKACCNPYHLEWIPTGLNSTRSNVRRWSRTRAVEPWEPKGGAY